MKKTSLALMIGTSIFGSTNLGSVAGITFGDSISRIKKIKSIKCSSFKESKLDYCSLENQKIIDDKRIKEIYFYFNRKDKLYQVKFYSKEIKISKRPVSSSEIPNAIKRMNKLKDFINTLPIENSKVVSKTKVSDQLMSESIVEKFYQAHQYYYNKNMDKEVEKYKKQLKDKKTKKIKASY